MRESNAKEVEEESKRHNKALEQLETAQSQAAINNHDGSAESFQQSAGDTLCRYDLATHY